MNIDHHKSQVEAIQKISPSPDSSFCRVVNYLCLFAQICRNYYSPCMIQPIGIFHLSRLNIIKSILMKLRLDLSFLLSITSPYWLRLQILYSDISQSCKKFSLVDAKGTALFFWTCKQDPSFRTIVSLNWR